MNNTYPIDRTGRSHWRIEERSILAALSVCGILTLGIYLSTSWASSHGNGAFWSFGSSAEAPVPVHTPPFQLSGIQISMTPLEAGSVQPEILFQGTEKVGKRAVFGSVTAPIRFLFQSPKRASRLTAFITPRRFGASRVFKFVSG